MVEQVTSNVGLCKDCNYPLRGLPSNRCPECGREFDPQDQNSMNLGRPMPRFAWRFLEPMGRRTRTLVVLGVIMLLWSSAALPFHQYGIVVGVVLSLILIVYQLARLILKFGVVLLYKQPLKRERRAYILWPLIVALALTSSPILFYLMVWLYRPDLDRFADQMAITPDLRVSRGPMRIGLLFFDEVRVDTLRIELRFSSGYGLYSGFDAPFDAGSFFGRWQETRDWPWPLWPELNRARE